MQVEIKVECSHCMWRKYLCKRFLVEIRINPNINRKLLSRYVQVSKKVSLVLLNNN